MFAPFYDPDRHSLRILDALYQYDDFMESIATLVDLGCGTGQDLEWWATRTTRDDAATPLNIQCVGVDLADQLQVATHYANITYQRTDFEDVVNPPKKKFDILWCYDSFQYCMNPIQTLFKWRDIASEGAMLAITVPQTTNFTRNRQDIHTLSGCYYHYSVVNLMYMLAVTGWDCREGFFKKYQDQNWITAVVYKIEQDLMDPRTTTWYELLEKNLLPDSAARSVFAHGHVKQQDLVLPWIDKSFGLVN